MAPCVHAVHVRPPLERVFWYYPPFPRPCQRAVLDRRFAAPATPRGGPWRAGTLCSATQDPHPAPPPPGGHDDPEEPAIANAADGTPGTPAPPKIAAVIAAHPDDPDFGAGGTAALWTRQGWEFHYIVVTNGAKGSDDPTMTRDRLVAAREQEQRACAAVLGVSSCVFLGGEDGELDYSRAMLGKIVREIRRLKPLAVFTHSDQIIHRRPGAVDADEAERFVGFINHRDHRNTGAMAVDAVYPTARDHMNFPEQIREEGLETHKVSQVYIWGHPEANFSVDITDSVERKLSGLMEHKTQFGSRGDAFTSGMRDRFRDPDGHFYERFLRVDLPS